VSSKTYESDIVRYQHFSKPFTSVEMTNSSTQYQYLTITHD